MPPTFNIGEAKTQLSHLIAQAEEGRDVVIARNGVPVARTVELLRQERKERPSVSAAEIRAARDEGRA